MKTMIRFLLCGCILLLLAVLPAAASPVLASDSFTPDPPLVPGGEQQVAATFVIPSGTTFPKDHELQLQTQLADAQWVIQVVVDGNNAARQTASGSAAFISGQLLSYSVNRDVGFTVTINGKVPASATGSVTVLDLVEIDNTNNIVPGSEIVISQPVAGTGTAPAVTTVPAMTPPQVTTAPPVTKTPGFSLAIGIVALTLVGILGLRCRK